MTRRTLGFEWLAAAGIIFSFVAVSPDSTAAANGGAGHIISAHADDNPALQEIRDALAAGQNPNAADGHGLTALMIAVEHDFIELGHLLLEAGADPNLADQSGETALMRATQLAQPGPWVTLLVEAGADLEHRDHEGQTALIAATEYAGSPAAVSALLEAGANLQAQDNYGYQATHYAAHYLKHQPSLAHLLQAGADPNARDQEGQTPLHYAIMGDASTLSVSLLLEAGADVDAASNSGYTPLMQAAADYPHLAKMARLIEGGADATLTDAYGKGIFAKLAANPDPDTARSEAIIKLLLEAGADINQTDADGMTAATDLAGLSDLPQVQALLARLVQHGLDVTVADNSGYLPIHYAASNGSTGLINVLLAAGSPVDAVTSYDETPLEMAVDYNHFEAVKRLLAAGADAARPDNQGMTPLLGMLYYGKGSVDIARALVSAGADPADVSHDGSTALHQVMLSGERQSEMLAFLLQQGLDVNAANNDGITPIMAWSRADWREGFDLLIKAGANPAAQDNYGQNALHRQIHSSTPPALINAFVEAGLPVDAIDHSGRSALYSAISQDALNQARTLLSLGADASLVDDSGQTPLFAMTYQPNRALLRLLIKAGADINHTDNNGQTLLMHFLGWNANPQGLRTLMDADANLDLQDDSGQTAFMKLLSAAQNFRAANVLIKAGVDWSKTDDYGQTALHHYFNRSLEQTDQALTKALLEAAQAAKVDLNQADQYGRTVLHLAAGNTQDPASVTLLLAAGANPFALTENQDTVLHSALERYGAIPLDILKPLVAAGLDVNAQNRYEQTPLALASRNPDNSAVTAWLLEKGAR